MKTSSKAQAEDLSLVERQESALTVFQVTDEDFEPPTHVEAPIVPFIGVRQKPLVSDEGRTLKDAGGFKVSDAQESDEDPSEMHLAILDNRVTRVYFESLTDTEPVCKSNDGVKGSRPREDGYFGECATCGHSQFLESRPACKEGRNIFAFDLLRERFVVFTFSPSGLRPWRAYQSVLAHYAREKGLARPDGAVPYIGHLVRTRVTLKHKKDPAPHFVPVFERDGELPAAVQEQMRTARRTVKAEADRMLAAQEHRPEDYLGGNGS